LVRAALIIAPILLQLIDEYEGEVLLAKVEVDKGDGENMKLAGHYRVRISNGDFIY